MVQEGFKRKLTAILSADVEGYSRLMGEDEEATVRTLTTYREVLTTLIQQHNGKVVDSPGDNLLAEFASVVDAVHCAVAVQKEIKSRNDELPENRRMQFRIGINLGDVIQEEDRIYGDGVNIAARLESLAEPGGVCISKTAFDQIESKLPYGYEFLGDQTVKNIAKPVGAYRVLMETRVTVAEKPEKEKPSVSRRMPIHIASAAVLVLVLAMGIWQFYMRRPSMEPASLDKRTFPLPEKPSIAVLPFDNLSGDPDQEFIADGMTENIITTLSYIPEIFVIARNSTFTYKGKAVKAQEVAEDLGVRYILEGSVQRTGDRVRIMAQLIDAASGHHLWADRYDRGLQDLFALQDEITLKIVSALQVKLSVGVQIRLTRKTMPNFEAWSYGVRGYSHMMRHTKADNAKAREFFEQAAGLVPGYGPVITALGLTHVEDARHGWSGSREESLQRAGELAKKALALDDSDPMIHALWGGIYLLQGRYDQAIAEGKKSVALGPNQADPHFQLAMLLHVTGRYKEALPLVRKAIRLHPYYPYWYPWLLASVYLRMEEYEKAVETFKMVVVREPHRISGGHLGLAITYIRLGREEQARSEAAEVLRLDPEFSLEGYRKQAHGRDMDPAIVESDIEALREAGLK
jgi:adenylate cyclase